MWYERLLNVIDSSWIGAAVDRRMELMRKTDPEHIYVENIRSFFNVTYGIAKFFCESAVRQGVFNRRIGYMCPNDNRIIMYAAPGEEISDTVVCHICEADGKEECEFKIEEVPTIEVYSLVV